MLRALFFIVLPLCLSACIAKDDEDDILNDQGETVADPTLRLNGLWNGQLDQAGALRTLIYNGNLFAFDDTLAYYGTVSLTEEDAAMSATLTAYSYSSTDTGADQRVAGGTGTSYEFWGLLYPTTEADDTLVGDYEGGSNVGSFLLADDGTWTTRSSLTSIRGQWGATGYDLYLTEVNGELSFREVSSTVAGCTSRGTMEVVDSAVNLYRVQMAERKNCNGFNVTNAPGYATVNADGDLEWFIRRDSQLFYARFNPATSTDTTDTTDETADDSEETTE
ncbi:hypothetical protein [Thalassolituus sp.]|jgi:hypothetical protein|uniref:hypothetical protein n=1 Tax=Thalassolituus sp. TaxID=2030822 RepID=UPI002604494F|nr:hypothetical protein [uncultured Thalassolituus sp.]